MINYYKVLEVSEKASIEVIKASYKALVKKYHPDNSQDLDCEKKMLAINEAYEILSNEDSKQKYDLELQAFRMRENCNTENHSQEPFQQEEVERHNPPSGKIARFIKSVGKEILDSMAAINEQCQNAYFDGLRMSDAELIHAYRTGKGYKKPGYAKAMEERGFLRKKAEGGYEATYKLKDYLRY